MELGSRADRRNPGLRCFGRRATEDAGDFPRAELAGPDDIEVQAIVPRCRPRQRNRPEAENARIHANDHFAISGQRRFGKAIKQAVYPILTLYSNNAIILDW